MRQFCQGYLCNYFLVRLHSRQWLCQLGSQAEKRPIKPYLAKTKSSNRLCQQRWHFSMLSTLTHRRTYCKIIHHINFTEERLYRESTIRHFTDALQVTCLASKVFVDDLLFVLLIFKANIPKFRFDHYNSSKRMICVVLNSHTTEM